MAKNQKHRRLNPIARAPILRKGGAHTKSRSTERQQAKQTIKQQLNHGAGQRSPYDLIALAA